MVEKSTRLQWVNVISSTGFISLDYLTSQITIILYQYLLTVTLLPRYSLYQWTVWQLLSRFPLSFSPKVWLTGLFDKLNYYLGILQPNPLEVYVCITILFDKSNYHLVTIYPYLLKALYLYHWINWQIKLSIFISCLLFNMYACHLFLGTIYKFDRIKFV